jgi:hypothetical protein
MKFLKHMVLICSVLFNPLMTMAQDTGMSTGMETKTGIVAETIAVPTYTYIRLEEFDVWIATPTLIVSEGDTVEYAGGMEMGQFYSKALDRTFDNIFFIQNVAVVSRDVENMHRADMQAHLSGTEKMALPKPVTVEAPVAGDIELLKGGKNIAQIYSGSDELSEQTVQLRARVMKISLNVMGKNWVTLQDGTGTAPDNKLLATSEEKVSPGDLVVATGVVRKDADIGSGYKYKVLLEKATFVKSAE